MGIFHRGARPNGNPSSGAATLTRLRVMVRKNKAHSEHAVAAPSAVTAVVVMMMMKIDDALNCSVLCHCSGATVDTFRTSTAVERLALLPHSKEVAGSIGDISIPNQGLSARSSPVPAWVPSECSSFLPRSKDFQVR